MLVTISSKNYSFYFRINARKTGLKLGTARNVSRRKFTFTSDERIENLRQTQLKKRTEKKMFWGVNAYVQWREERLKSFNYDYPIFMADLNNLETLEKENLVYALVRFIPEVTKLNGEGVYPGKTLYQMCTSIQKFLNVNNIPWKIVKDPEFIEVQTVLDNIMKERAAAKIGTVKRQAEVLTYDYENELWENGSLGEHNPDILRSTVMFLIGIHCILRAGDEHYYLRRDMPNQPSQLQLKKNSKGQRCLVYTEDTVTKANDGGLKNMKSDRKIVWVYPSSNINRCPVRLVEKYLSLCPPYYGKSNFYLQSLQKPTVNRWYAGQVVGQNTLAKTIKSMLHNAKIEGFFTGHSLRMAGMTRLFQAGVDRKIIKEMSGHRSDAVDCYSVTSDEQKETVSHILGSRPGESKTQKEHARECKVESTEGKCIDSMSQISVKEGGNNKICSSSGADIGQLVSEIIDHTCKKGKTVIKVEIEISHD